jgi:hypothetical protein
MRYPGLATTVFVSITATISRAPGAEITDQATAVTIGSDS